MISKEHKAEILEVTIRDIRHGINFKVVKPVNLYKCQFGDNCFVGPFVEIQKGVIIGNNCKVQSHTFICELVIIGDDCFIGHNVSFTNDRFSTGSTAGGKKDLWEKTIIGNSVLIGSGSSLLPVNICDDVVIGAGSVVTKDINRPGIYAGVPAKFIKPLPQNK